MARSRPSRTMSGASSMARTCHCTDGCSAAKAASRGASHSDATDPLAEIASIGRTPRARSRTASQAVASCAKAGLHRAQQRLALCGDRGAGVAGAVAGARQQRRAERRLQPADLVAHRAGADMQRQRRRARSCRGARRRRTRAAPPAGECGRSSLLNITQQRLKISRLRNAVPARPGWRANQREEFRCISI